MQSRDNGKKYRKSTFHACKADARDSKYNRGTKIVAMCSFRKRLWSELVSRLSAMVISLNTANLFVWTCFKFKFVALCVNSLDF